MGVRVAYGKKGRISAAIASGTIPRDSLIITSDSKESELYFYDANGEMKNISERKQFETLTEAQAWSRPTIVLDTLFQCITVLIGFRISFLLTGNCLPLMQATLALAMSK